MSPDSTRALVAEDLDWLRSLPERWGMDRDERQIVDRILAALPSTSASLGGEEGLNRGVEPYTGTSDSASPAADDFGAELGRVTWLSSGEDEGPDCGLIVGLGEGLSLHAGEFSNRKLEEYGLDPVAHASAWHIALYSEAMGWRFFGTVTDTFEAQYAIEEIAGALRSAAGQSLTEASVYGAANKSGSHSPSEES